MKILNRRRSWTIPAKSQINVTPLIDVLLVLIVIFMVIAPSTPKGLDTRVPQPAPADSQRNPRVPDTNLILSLDQNGVIRLNQETLDLASLAPRLEEVLRTRADRTIFVQADDEVLFNDVAQIIDTARGAGAGLVGLMPSRIGAIH
jgi:biopolymer transport protein TolR